MKYQIVFLLLFFSVGLVGQELKVKSPVRFLALGDSYTIGQGVQPDESWPKQLIKELENSGVQIDKLAVIAQTGWTTKNLLNAIHERNPDTDFNLVSLLIGVNNQYQGINIEAYKVEFQQLLEMAIDFCGGSRNGVFVLSIPDYGYTPFGIGNQIGISAEINDYNAINKEIADEMGVSYFNITSISREALSKPWYLASDSLHPSGEMYARWVELIIDNINMGTLSTNNFFESTDKKYIFPNPANNYITIRAPQFASMVEIYNTSGIKLLEKELSDSNNLKIDISGLREGIYFYHILSHTNRKMTGKFIVN